MSHHFTYQIDSHCIIVCAVVWAFNFIIAAPALYHRDAPRIRQVSPELTVAANLSAFLWWLDQSLSSQLNRLWNPIGGCWVWNLAARSLFYTLFVGCLLVKQHLAYVRWMTDDEGSLLRSLFLLGGWVFLWALLVLLVALLEAFAGVNDGDDQGSAECDLPNSVLVGYELYQASLVLAFYVMVVLLVRAVYHVTDKGTRRSMRYDHPKVSDAAVEGVGLVVMVVAHVVLHDGNLLDISTERADCARMAIVSTILPAIMYWAVLLPPLCSTLRRFFARWACCGLCRDPGDEAKPLNDAHSSRIFDHATGLYGPGLARLPLYRRTQAEERQQDSAESPRERAAPEEQHEEVQRVLDLVRRGDAARVRDFLIRESSCGPWLVNVPGAKGQTALHVALQASSAWAPETRARMVELLIDMQARMQAADADGNNAAHYAALLGDPSMLVLMVSRAKSSAKYGDVVDDDIQALMNALSREYATPLHIAVTKEDKGTLTTLLGLGADPNRCTPEREEDRVKADEWDSAYEQQIGQYAPRKSPFMLACELNLPAVAKQLARSCLTRFAVDFNAIGPLGMSPLAAGCYLGLAQVVVFLLEQGADPWFIMPGLRRLTAVHCAVMGGDAVVLYQVLRGIALSDPPQGTTAADGDSWLDRGSFSAVSESEVSTVGAGQTPRQRPHSAAPRYHGTHSSTHLSPGHHAAADPLPRGASAPLSPPSHPAEQPSGLLTRALALAELGAQEQQYAGVSSRRGQSSVFDDALAQRRDDVPEDDTMQALAVLAARGALPPSAAQQLLLDALTKSWCLLSVGTAPAAEVSSFAGLSAGSAEAAEGQEHVDAIVEAAKAALACPDSNDRNVLLDVLLQDQYQWTGAGFASPMTEPKARQLAAEINKRVVNPPIPDARTAVVHQGTLRRQCAQLRRQGRADEAARLQQALDTLVAVQRQQRPPPPASPSIVGGGGDPASHRQAGTYSTVSAFGLSHDSPAAPALHNPRPPGFGDSPAPPLPPVSASTFGGGEGAGCFTDADAAFDAVPLSVTRQLDRADCWGRTALHYAVDRRNAGAVFLLVALGANVAIRDRRSRRRQALGLSPLQYAERLAAPGCPGGTASVLSALLEGQRVRNSSVPRRHSGGQQQSSVTTQGFLGRTPPTSAAADPPARRQSSQRLTGGQMSLRHQQQQQQQQPRVRSNWGATPVSGGASGFSS
eukprot:TRINITY_DN15004_c0_g1_i1.p1 TRINITY_DN15004_c0_g1~~TRINITY_DN15004_c0_g1_i1.p1  ORF type:complete len:1234 (+),score=424.72 TRINITY_DN15004_c0_g1_i1:120-3704(+)